MTDVIDEIMQTEEQRRAFGLRLKELRKQQHKTQKEVATRIGLQLHSTINMNQGCIFHRRIN